MQITVLGNGDSMGTPRVYCDCPVCGEARLTGNNRRFRSALWIETDHEPPLLLDCGPDWKAQMEGIAVRGVSMALLTHAHFDHVGGLTELADACRWREDYSNIYAPGEVLEAVRSQFPWIENRLKMHANDEGMMFGDWRIVPWRVNHGKNGYSYAYLFHQRELGVKWAYCSDAINLTDEQKAPLAGLDLLILGTSFAEEAYPMDTRSVYDMKEGIRLAEEVKPKKVLFTHLSHDIDLNRDYGLPETIQFAVTGMKIRL